MSMSLPLPMPNAELMGHGHKMNAAGLHKFHAQDHKAPISSANGMSTSLPPVKYQEMSPEVTLVEFISTSAAFHGIKKQNIKELEWDILKVFTNNVMPANAAAWYMAKRRFYMTNTYEHQLLPFLLKNYPKKFAVKGNVVEFLETYNKEVARKKMLQMINQGLLAYFQHKVEEYGVYFFDPYYYETTEPFHANLQVATKGYTHRSKLLPTFFGQHENQFVYQSHSPYLVTISKQPVEVKINTVGIVVRMVDNQFGIIQFPSGTATEKALFSAKSLFRDGWLYQGDPMKLPPMEFDGYRVPGAVGCTGHPGKSGEKGGAGVEYTWYAVLVWCGRKPSPKYCATKEDLTSSPYFKSVQNNPGLPLGNMLSSGVSFGELSQAANRRGGFKKGHMQQTDVKIPCMQVGEVLSIKNNGAVVSLGKDSNEKAFIPGWAHRNLKFKGDFMTTTQGVELAIGDLITFCIDPSQPESKSYKCVGCNVTVLKHADYKGRGMGANSATLLPAGDASSSANTLPSREGSHHLDGGNGKKGKKERKDNKKANKDKTSANATKQKGRKKSEGGDSSSNEKGEVGANKRKSRGQKKSNRKSSHSVSSGNGLGKDVSGKDKIEETVGKRTKRRSEGSRPPRKGPKPYLRFLLAPPKSKDETKEGEEESAKVVESSDSESEYDSDVDPGFVPPTSHDPDLDYDEYSDGEVPEEEEKSLLEDAKQDFTEEMRLELQKKMEEFEETEKQQKEKEGKVETAATIPATNADQPESEAKEAAPEKKEEETTSSKQQPSGEKTLQAESLTENKEVKGEE